MRRKTTKEDKKDLPEDKGHKEERDILEFKIIQEKCYKEDKHFNCVEDDDRWPKMRSGSGLTDSVMGDRW